MKNLHAVKFSSLISLRPYQEECISESIRHFQDLGIKRQAVSLPVGSGKTVIFSNLINRITVPKPGATKVLIMAHREELLYQAFANVKRFMPNARISIDAAAQRADFDNSDVIISSVPSLKNARLKLYNPDLFKCIIIDEAHHAAAQGYLNILKHFRSDKHRDDSHILVWGCSATLRRHDGLSLNVAFDKIVYEKDFASMIKDKFLCDFQLLSVQTNTDLKGISSLNSDYNTSQLSKAVNTPERNSLIVSTYRTIKSNPHCLSWISRNNSKSNSSIFPLKSTLVFAVDIQHIDDLVNAFEKQGILARGISSRTPHPDRKLFIDLFKSGSLPVLINCGILTEGVDIPSIDCIFLARPTKSLGLLQQMLGRGLRTHPEKEFCAIIDFVDVMAYNAQGILASPATLLGLPQEFRVTHPPPLKKMEKIVNDKDRIEPIVMTDMAITFRTFRANYLTQLDEDSRVLQNYSSLAWVRIGESDFCLALPDQQSSILIIKEENILRSYKHTKLQFKSNKTIQKKIFLAEHDSIESAIRAWDSWTWQTYGRQAMNFCGRHAAWRKLPASESQQRYLSRYIPSLLDPTQIITRGKASDAISRLAHGSMKKAKDAERKEKLQEKKEAQLARQLDMLKPTLE